MSKLFVDEIKGNTGTTVTVPTGQKIIGTDTGSIYAPGMIIQMGGDSWAPGATRDITTTGSTWYGADLEVSITFKSTSNKFWVQIFIPDGYNNGTATRCIDGGFVYSTDSFSSHEAVFGPQAIISDHMGYSTDTADLHPHLYNTWGTVPTVSAIKIRPYLIARNGTYRTNANSLGVYCLTVMEIAQ